MVVPDIAKNIISVGCLEAAGNEVHMKSGVITITNKKGKAIKINKDVNGNMYHLRAKRNSGNEINTSRRTLDINKAHELYGHPSDGVLKSFAREENITLTGSKKTCEACAYAKAKAKALNKATTSKATEKGERFYVDFSGPYKKTAKGSKYWLLITDDKTRKSWSYFVNQKTQIKEVMTRFLNMMKGANVKTKYIRGDNAGENTKQLKELCDEKGITMEFTAPYTPQLNGVVERKFVTIRDRAQAMMLGAHLDNYHQGILWAEAVNMSTQLSNALPNRVTKE